MTPAVGYTEMRDSGFPDIGSVPSAWTIMKVKHIFDVICGATPKENPENWDGNIPWIGPSDMPMTGTIEHGKRFISELGYASCGTTLVPQNSIIISTRAPIGKICIAANRLCTNQGCKALVPRNKSINNRFFAYYLRSIIERLEVDGTGTTFKELSTSKLLNEPLIAPPISEQSAIAAYLDTQCAKIDEIIAEVKASIEDYKQWKASIIYESVTKGLDPNVEMKDSGIEWIGEIPAGWALAPFKYVLTERRERNVPIKSTERLSLSIDLGVTLYSEKTTNLDRFKEDFKQYKIAYKGDLVMNSMNMIVGASGVSNYFGCVSPAYYTFYDNTQNHVTAKYCEYIFRSKAMLRVLHNLGKGIYSIERGDDRVNTCRLKVSKEDLGRIMLPLPSENIQESIVNYLNKMCAEIDTLVTAKQALIADLETYKKSLIYEVVTGKRRVC